MVLLANRSAQLYDVANHEHSLPQRGGEGQNETLRVPNLRYVDQIISFGLSYALIICIYGVIDSLLSWVYGGCGTLIDRKKLEWYGK